MKPITLTQWKKMSSRHRSWLICKTLGESPRVYWHLHLPDGEIAGGSHRSMNYCLELLARCRKLKPSQVRKAGWDCDRHPWADCTVRPSVAYPLYAELDHLAPELLKHLLSSGAGVVLKHYQEAGLFMVGDSTNSSLGETLAAATCLTFLKSKNLILEPSE